MSDRTTDKCIDCGVSVYHTQAGLGLCLSCYPKYGFCQYCGYGESCHKLTKDMKSFNHVYLGTTEPKWIKIWLCDEHINSLDNKDSYQPLKLFLNVYDTEQEELRIKRMKEQEEKEQEEKNVKVRLFKCLCGKARMVSVIRPEGFSKEVKKEHASLVAAGCDVETISLENARNQDFCFDCIL